MLPSFGTVLGEVIPAYFTMLALGFGVATYMARRWAIRSGEADPEVIIDAGLASLIGGIVGGRILHVLADGYFWDYVHLCTDPSLVGWQITRAQCALAEGSWDAVAAVCRPVETDCWAWARFYNGGLAYYGGLVGGTAAAVWILRRSGAPVRRTADVVGPGVAAGLFLGRVGCFLGGCCYGHPTDHVWGLSFPAWSAVSEGQFRAGLLASPGLPSLPVHATQIYEALGCLAISLGLWFYALPRRRFDGQIMLAFLLAYALLRFLVEFLRADDRGGFWGLSTSQ